MNASPWRSLLDASMMPTRPPVPSNGPRPSPRLTLLVVVKPPASSPTFSHVYPRPRPVCPADLNPGWAPADGGQLRLWTYDESQPRATISPTLDRVVCFWSDHRVSHEPPHTSLGDTWHALLPLIPPLATRGRSDHRVPHEVLPAHRERAAISVWFHVPDNAQPPSCPPRAPPTAPSAKNAQEQAYLANLKTTANALRTRFYAEVRTADKALRAGVDALRPPPPSSANSNGAPGSAAGVGASDEIEWIDSVAVASKCKILLHQLLPSSDLVSGCTQLLLCRVGAHPKWLAKLRGAKALVIIPLGPTHDGGGVSVHCRRHHVRKTGSGSAEKTEHLRGGWPKVDDAPVRLSSTPMPTLHIFDCSTSPLYVWLQHAVVLAMWSFGEHAEEGDVRNRQAEAALQPCDELPTA